MKIPLTARESGGGKERIRKKIILPFTALIVAILLLCLYGAYLIQQHHLNTDVNAKIRSVNHLFERLLGQEAKFMKAQLEFIAEDEALINAWSDRDRKELYRIARPLFERIKSNFGVTHFYFIEPDLVCFLRVHSPENHGDLIARYTMLQAAAGDAPVYGIELGPLGTFTLRVVYPWIIKGELLGYIELGEEIEHLTAYLEDVSGLEFIFTIDKSRLERKKWETGVRILGKDDNWDDFDDFVVIDKSIQDIKPELKGRMIEALQNPDLSNTNLKIDDGHCRLAVLPLKDAGANTVGNLFAIYDITDKIVALRKGLLTSLVVLLIMSGCVLAFFYLYLSRIEAELAEYHSGLEKLVNKRTADLRKALNDVKTLRGLVPICSHCKKIRDDAGYWNKLETYLGEHLEARFSHGICDDCVKEHYPSYDDEEEEDLDRSN